MNVATVDNGVIVGPGTATITVNLLLIAAKSNSTCCCWGYIGTAIFADDPHWVLQEKLKSRTDQQ